MNSLQALSLSNIISAVFLFIGTIAMAMIATSWLIDFLHKRDVVAHSNHRSMHDEPVPVGGGWVIVIMTLLAWLIATGAQDEWSHLALFFGFLVLAILSFIDDRITLSSSLRFGVQIAAIALTLLTIPSDQTVFTTHWPLFVDRLLTGFCWLWFVNLFNFMDGIDGLAGIEIVAISIGVVLLGTVIGIDPVLLVIAIVVAGTTLGFLWWNWHPAKIFMGDVGSIPISFLLGWLLVRLAIEGYLAAALLLPAYFVADATLTLAKRLYRREKIWEAHKSHYYQRAAMSTGSHSAIVRKIIPGNIALVVLAFLSISYPLLSMLAGLGVVIFMLFQLEQISQE